MTLVFSTMELAAIFASVLIYDLIATDGKFVTDNTDQTDLHGSARICVIRVLS